jgi:PrcB C-terminal
MTARATIALLWWMVASMGAAADPMPFKTIDRGGHSEIEEAREVVAHTAAEWSTLWRQHAPDRPRPAVDFTRSMVIGVFLGSRPTGGYAVDVERIDGSEREVTVTWREAKPPADAVVTQVITTPYHLVTVDHVAGAVRFARAR